MQETTPVAGGADSQRPHQQARCRHEPLLSWGEGGWTELQLGVYELYHGFMVTGLVRVQLDRSAGRVRVWALEPEPKPKTLLTVVRSWSSLLAASPCHQRGRAPAGPAVCS